jgi:acyl carrier protein
MNTTLSIVVAAIQSIAPEVDESDLVPGARLQEDLDLDSMDFLDVITELAIRTGVEIPERDYPQLATVQGCVDYLAGLTATV